MEADCNEIEDGPNHGSTTSGWTIHDALPSTAISTCLKNLPINNQRITE